MQHLASAAHPMPATRFLDAHQPLQESGMTLPGIYRPTPLARAASLAATLALLTLAAPTPATAASITYSDPQCASFTISSSGPGTFTLTCAKLSCSIEATGGVTSLLLGTGTTLTATCNPVPDQGGYEWTQGDTNSPNCPSLPGGSLATQTLSGASVDVSGCVYRVTGTSATNGSGSAAITLGWSASPPPPPPATPTGCVPQILSTSPSPLTSAGGTVQLDVTGCSPSTGLTYKWFRNGSTTEFSTAKNPTDTLGANSGSSSVSTTYQVEVCNGGACTAKIPSSALTATVPGTGPGSGSTNLCAAQGFSKTIYRAWNWATEGNLVLDTVTMKDQAGGTGIGTNGILVVEFTPTSPADVDNLARISVTEYPGNSVVTQRTLAISTQPCDLVGLVPGPATNTTSPKLDYGVGTVTNSAFSGKPKGVAVTPGVQYFINIAGRSGVSATSPSGSQSCFPSSSQVCDVRASLFKPSGH
jgi:hypothetical protein